MRVQRTKRSLDLEALAVIESLDNFTCRSLDSSVASQEGYLLSWFSVPLPDKKGMIALK